jgi:hypothetical protein
MAWGMGESSRGDEARATLLSFNTVERLLRGDYFHTVHWDTVVAELARFPKEWRLAGVGTTNWFERNGETIIHGTVGAPKVFWSDPKSVDPMHVIDLLKERPSGDGPDLVSPSFDDEGVEPPFPFLALGVCDPATRVQWEAPAGEDLHGWLEGKLVEENIGLAAVEVTGGCRRVEYAAAYHLPLVGVDFSEGYRARDIFRLAEHEGGCWRAGGVYAANETLQRIISVAGLPLHLHGYEEKLKVGGHLTRVEAESVNVSVWPLKDFLLEIKNLDRERVAVREVGGE